MRRKYFALVYLVVGCALLFQSGCQKEAEIKTGPGGLEEPETVGAVDGPQPKITFETLGHDFGQVSPNKLHTGQIKFTNTGEGVLNISKVAQCCSVVATLADEKKEYAPGESGAVNVEWRSGSRAINFARDLVVHSNDKTNPAVKLKIQAKIVLNITWEPERLKILLNEEKVICPKVTVRSLDGHPFSITGFKATGDCITADFDPTVEATKFVLEPKVNIEKLRKNLQGRIMIGLTHPDGNAAIVLFDVAARYAVDRPTLLFFNAEPDKPIVTKISVWDNYEKDFAVVSLSSRTGAVGVRILNKIKTTDGYQLEIELTPPASEGKMKFQDEFYLTLEGGEKLSIKCNGYYKRTKPVTTTK